MQRPVLIDQGHEPRHQLVAFVIGEAAQRHVATKMLVAVGVAARTAQRTFFGDFDRYVRTIAREDPAPRLDQLACADGGSAHLVTILSASRDTAVYEFTDRWFVILSAHVTRTRAPAYCPAAITSTRLGRFRTRAHQQEPSHHHIRRRTYRSQREPETRDEVSQTRGDLVFHGEYPLGSRRHVRWQRRAVHQPRVPSQLLQPESRPRHLDPRRPQHRT